MIIIRTIAASFVFALFMGTILPDTPARACSDCLTGDPVYQSLGTTPPEKGRWFFRIEHSFFRRTVPDGPDEEEFEEFGFGEEFRDDGVDEGFEDPNAMERRFVRQLDLSAAYSPTDRLTTALQVPFRWIETEEESAFHDDEIERTSGLGDIQLNAHYKLWRNRPVAPTRLLSAIGGVKFPTGDYRQKDRDGDIEIHDQVGTGSFDFFGGFSYTHLTHSADYYASVLGRINQPNRFGYEFGDLFLVNFAAQKAILPDLALIGEINFRYGGIDETGHDGAKFAHSGGPILFFSPGFQYVLAKGKEARLLLRIQAMIPVWDDLFGGQEEDPVYRLGLVLNFGRSPRAHTIMSQRVR